LLENWNKKVRNFVKVMPKEYRAVLEKLQNKAA
jgi:glutamate synthase domain-containing protein 3